MFFCDKVVTTQLSWERVCVHHSNIHGNKWISVTWSHVAIEHKSRNPEVPPIWSRVLDILATPKPFYNLVSAMKPTDSKKVTEFLFHKLHRHSGERVRVHYSKIRVSCGVASLVVPSSRAQITKPWGSTNLVQSSRHSSSAQVLLQSCLDNETNRW